VPAADAWRYASEVIPKLGGNSCQTVGHFLRRALIYVPAQLPERQCDIVNQQDRFAGIARAISGSAVRGGLVGNRGWR